MPKMDNYEVIFTDGWSQDDHKAYAKELKRRHLEQTFFMRALAPSPFHWQFQQAYDALQNDLYLPGLSGLLNGIEASLRTICCHIKDIPLDGDLGRVMSNGLLKEARDHGMNIEKLAFPGEEDFMDCLDNPKAPVQLVRLRNDICHGNFQSYGRELLGIGDFFTPECLGPVSATLLDVCFEWALEVAGFMESRGWRSTEEKLEKPVNPLKKWKTPDDRFPHRFDQLSVNKPS